MPLSQALAAHLRVSEELTARRAMPDEDEAFGWVSELATTKIFGSREQNVLGLKNVDDGAKLLRASDQQEARVNGNANPLP